MYRSLLPLCDLFLNLTKLAAEAKNRGGGNDSGARLAALEDTCFITGLAYEYARALFTLFQSPSPNGVPFQPVKRLVPPLNLGFHFTDRLHQLLSDYVNASKAGYAITSKETTLWNITILNFLYWIDIATSTLRSSIKPHWSKLLKEGGATYLDTKQLLKATTVAATCLSHASSGPLNFKGERLEEDIWLAYGSAMDSIFQFVHAEGTYKNTMGVDVLGAMEHVICIVESLGFVAEAKYSEGGNNGDPEADAARNRTVNNNVRYFANALCRISQPIPEEGTSRTTAQNKVLKFAASQPVQDKVKAACENL